MKRNKIDCAKSNRNKKYLSREKTNVGTDRETEGVGRDMPISFKLFLEMQTSKEA